MKTLFRFLGLLGFIFIFFLLGYRESNVLISSSDSVVYDVFTDVSTVDTGVAEYYKEVFPEKDHKQALITLLRVLASDHYNYQISKKHITEKVLMEYLDRIDSAKNLFYISDIERFKQYVFSHNYTIEESLNFVYQVYNLAMYRSIEKYLYFLSEAGNDFAGIEFDKDEVLKIKRDWPENKFVQRDVWRKVLKNDYLRLYISGKNSDEIKTIIIESYKGNLKSISKTKTDEVFSVFANSIAVIYDAHSMYLSSGASQEFKTEMSLKLEGIGAVLEKDNGFIKIKELISGGPAEKSGLKRGDIIIGVSQGVDEKFINISDYTLSEAIELIRGKRGTIIRLQIKEKQGPVVVKRDAIKLEDRAAKGEIEKFGDNKVGIIKIPSFYRDFEACYKKDPDCRSLVKDVEKILKNFKKEKVSGLVLDLRNNGGGSLVEAGALTGLFIEEGALVQIRLRGGKLVRLNISPSEHRYNGPVLVLVNAYSASASEIFAAAIQDYGRGVVVGSSTYGKGTVQDFVEWDYGGLLLTIAKFYRVSGESTQCRGVIPDIDFPDIFTGKKIIEKDLPNHLLYDTVNSLIFKKYSKPDDLGILIYELMSAHKKRISNNLEFKAINESIEFWREKEGVDISLYEPVKRRIIEEREAVEKKLEKALKNDPFLKESINILIDMINYKN